MDLHKPNVFQVFTGILVLLMAALVVGGGAWMATMVRDLRMESDARQEVIDGLAADYAALYAQAQAEGVEPDAPAPAEVAEVIRQGERGEPGEPGPPPSLSTVVDAVRIACGPPSTLCAGRDGKDGAPGVGVPGRDGTNGKDGQPGIPGPPPSAEDVFAAVAEYCAGFNNCAGPAGADSTVPGPIGPMGPPGPSCPDGATRTTVSVQLRTDPNDPSSQEWRMATLCLND